MTVQLPFPHCEEAVDGILVPIDVSNSRQRTVPVRVPMEGYERCMEQGKYAETIASKLRDVKVTWSCQTSE
jgi:hypothetical protein